MLMLSRISLTLFFFCSHCIQSMIVQFLCASMLSSLLEDWTPASLTRNISMDINAVKKLLFLYWIIA